jgi:hypothetical protein
MKKATQHSHESLLQFVKILATAGFFLIPVNHYFHINVLKLDILNLIILFFSQVRHIELFGLKLAILYLN